MPKWTTAQCASRRQCFRLLHSLSFTHRSTCNSHCCLSRSTFASSHLHQVCTLYTTLLATAFPESYEMLYGWHPIIPSSRLCSKPREFDRSFTSRRSAQHSCAWYLVSFCYVSGVFGIVSGPRAGIGGICWLGETALCLGLSYNIFFLLGDPSTS